MVGRSIRDTRFYGKGLKEFFSRSYITNRRANGGNRDFTWRGDISKKWRAAFLSARMYSAKATFKQSQTLLIVLRKHAVKPQ
jgi:hypothetical protein